MLIPTPKNCDVSVKKAIQLLSTKLDYDAEPTFAIITLTNLTASSLIGTNASKVLESVTIGTSLDYTRPTLNTIQDIRVIASPTFAGLTITGNSVFGLNSSVFQPAAGGDSTTFFQIKNAAGTQVVGVDTSNGRVMIGEGNPVRLLDLKELNNDGQIRCRATDAAYWDIGRGAGGSFIFKEDDGNVYVEILPYGGMILRNDSTMLLRGINTAPPSPTTGAGIQFFSSNGSTVMGDGDRLGFFTFGGWDGGGINNSVGLTGFASGTWSDGDTPGELRFETTPVGLGTRLTRVTITKDGDFGLNEIVPETLLELTHAQPYLTLHNSTHENIDGGRESRIIFKGEKTDESEHTLAWIQASHNGTGDDQKGQLGFYTNDGSDGTTPTLVMTIDENQRMGIGTGVPSLKLDVKGTANTTFTNCPLLMQVHTLDAYAAGMGGGISLGGEYGSVNTTTFGYIAGLKENAVEGDYAGKLVFGTRVDGAGGADFTRMTILSTGAVFFTKTKLTEIGGYAVKLTNKTGVNSIAGQVVKADIANNDAVILTATDEFEAIGIFLDSGIADASEAWVVIFGIADIAMEDNTTATRGNWVRTSVTEAGYADATGAGPPGGGIPEIDQHLHEIGHCIESVTADGAGTHILARCIIHFN